MLDLVNSDSRSQNPDVFRIAGNHRLVEPVGAHCNVPVHDIICVGGRQQEADTAGVSVVKTHDPNNRQPQKRPHPSLASRATPYLSHTSTRDGQD